MSQYGRDRRNARQRESWRRMKDEDPERWCEMVKKTSERARLKRTLVFVSDYEKAGMMHLLKGAVEL